MSEFEKAIAAVLQDSEEKLTLEHLHALQAEAEKQRLEPIKETWLCRVDPFLLASSTWKRNMKGVYRRNPMLRPLRRRMGGPRRGMVPKGRCA